MNAKPTERQDKQEPYGTVTGPGEVRIERVLPGPIERVWAYLTESEKRRQWFAAGKMELREGGRLELIFHNSELSHHNEATPEKYQKYEGYKSTGQVTRFEPPRVLTFLWDEEKGPPSEVTFDLSPHGKEVLLVLMHRRLATRGNMVGVSGGWHIHLAILTDILNGVPPRSFWSNHAKLEAEYERRIPADVGVAPNAPNKKGESR
jgi:uncharacterized protein YndB with AHSA1/START domain